MSESTIRIAVISDIHCHPANEEGIRYNETYLVSDKLRTPSKDHPVEDLLRVIRDENLEADYTLCPGDLTNKSNLQGFIAGWNYSLEVHQNLQAKEIIATVGNHDVDSFNNYSSYSYANARGIKKGFPLANENECNTFWAKGCVFLERSNLRILVINSSHFHYNKEEAKFGRVESELIEYVRKYLESANDDKIVIAMSHHHPIDHSILNLGEYDKIANADELLNVLGDYNLDLFIHGHKHHPLLRYHHTSQGNKRIPIFASGSFSSTANLLYTSARNTFHIIELKKEKGESTCGKIKTWTFMPHLGWRQIVDETGFPANTGFGNRSNVNTIFSQIKELLSNCTKIAWEDVRSNISEIDNLIPSDAKELYQLLLKEEYIPDKDLWNNPKVIFNLNNFE